MVRRRVEEEALEQAAREEYNPRTTMVAWSMDTGGITRALLEATFRFLAFAFRPAAASLISIFLAGARSENGAAPATTTLPSPR